MPTEKQPTTGMIYGDGGCPAGPDAKLNARIVQCGVVPYILEDIDVVINKLLLNHDITDYFKLPSKSSGNKTRTQLDLLEDREFKLLKIRGYEMDKNLIVPSFDCVERLKKWILLTFTFNKAVCGSKGFGKITWFGEILLSKTKYYFI